MADTAEVIKPAQRAFGSSFYAAMRILPKAQRDAMFEIYSFCRAVDDIADSSAPRPLRINQLQKWRVEIEMMYDGTPPVPLQNLTRAVRTFDLRREDFFAIIEGMEMDVASDIRAPDSATLDLYCERVACAVGRISVRIFGLNESVGDLLAKHLGRALQLTNILRDLDEDAALGRLYLPHEALSAAGISTSEPMAALAHPLIGRVCSVLVESARAHFFEAGKLMSRCSRRSVRAPRIMCSVYQALLAKLVLRGFTPPRAPVRVGWPRLLWIILSIAII